VRRRKRKAGVTDHAGVFANGPGMAGSPFIKSSDDFDRLSIEANGKFTWTPRLFLLYDSERGK
jgi:hypothetical protein